MGLEVRKQDLEKWLWEGRDRAISVLGLDKQWWPNSIAAGDPSSAWGMAFFLAAADEQCVGKRLTLAANTNAQTEPIIRGHWLNVTSREHSSHEVLVDVSVHNWDAASPIQLTGESEIGPYHGVGSSMQGIDDYSWDFYKLLVMPSSFRMFFARVGGQRTGGSASDRINTLAGSLQELVDWYGPALLRPHDELGGAIVPYSGKVAGDTLLFWLDRGRLRFERTDKCPKRIDKAATGE